MRQETSDMWPLSLSKQKNEERYFLLDFLLYVL